MSAAATQAAAAAEKAAVAAEKAAVAAEKKLEKSLEASEQATAQATDAFGVRYDRNALHQTPFIHVLEGVPAFLENYCGDACLQAE